LEVGPKDVANNEVRAVRRDSGSKSQIKVEGLSSSITKLLNTIQSDLFSRAKSTRDAHLKYVTEWKDFVPALDGKNLVLIPWCEQTKCEEGIKDKSAKSSDEVQDEKAPSMGAKSLCIPFEQPKDRPITESTKCVGCGCKAKRWTLFGRSY
jgi:prolyl-tRNA synthetase